MQLRISILPVQLQTDSQSELLLLRLTTVQTTVNGCCDFIAQCTLVRIITICYLVSSRFLLKSLKDLPLLDRVG